MFQTLASATHHVSTAYGVSSVSYPAARRPPLQGIGQGNGAGPAIWALISAALFQMMYAKGLHNFLQSPLSKSTMEFVRYAFVDDTDLVQIGPSINSSGEEVRCQMQEALNWWEGGLRATGGALVPSKSHWYLIDFCWANGKWNYRTQHQWKDRCTWPILTDSR